MTKELSFFLEHILDAINNIETFMHGFKKFEFLNNLEKQSAVLRQIITIEKRYSGNTL